MLDTERFNDFDSAACASLAFMRERTRFDLCMVTRSEGDGSLVLHVEDESYGITPGDVLPWSDAMGMQPADGEGLKVVEVATQSAAPFLQMMRIGAFVGVPLACGDGSPFGTLCAVHPEPKQTSLVDDRPVLELISGLLSSLLKSEMSTASERRRAERAETEALTDVLTGLYNRRGWDLLAESEEARCVRYGYPACVLSIDLDGLKLLNDRSGHAAGDVLLKRAADAIKSSLREHDVAARTGGDEFLVLGIECGGADAQILRRRVANAMKLAGVQASVGMARRNPQLGLSAATREADALMYARKAATRSGRTDDGPLTLAA